MKVLFKILLGFIVLLTGINAQAQYDFSLTKLLFEIKTDAEVEALYENHFKAELKDSIRVPVYRYYSYNAKKGIEGYNEEIRAHLFEMRDFIQDNNFKYEELFFSEITMEEDSVTSVFYKQRFANKKGYLEILFEPVFRSEGDWRSYSSFHVYCNHSELDLSELKYIQLDIDTSGMATYKNRLISILESENKNAFEKELLQERDLTNSPLDERLIKKLLRNVESLHEEKEKYWRTIKAMNSYSMCDQLDIKYFWQTQAGISYRMIMLEYLQNFEYKETRQIVSILLVDTGKEFKLVAFDD